jgi:hypothetical protein
MDLFSKSLYYDTVRPPLLQIYFKNNKMSFIERNNRIMICNKYWGKQPVRATFDSTIFLNDLPVILLNISDSKKSTCLNDF